MAARGMFATSDLVRLLGLGWASSLYWMASADGVRPRRVLSGQCLALGWVAGFRWRRGLAAVAAGGLAAADATMLLSFAGIFAMLFFVTLYMQEILHYSPFRAGAGYVPITAGFAVAGGISSQLITRVGARIVIVAGALIGEAGVYLLARVPAGGSYVADVLPGMLIMALGMGAVFVAATAAANDGVPASQAGWPPGCSTPPSSSAARSAWPFSPRSPPAARRACSPRTRPPQRP